MRESIERCCIIRQIARDIGEQGTGGLIIKVDISAVMIWHKMHREIYRKKVVYEYTCMKLINLHAIQSNRLSRVNKVRSIKLQSSRVEKLDSATAI